MINLEMMRELQLSGQRQKQRTTSCFVLVPLLSARFFPIFYIFSQFIRLLFDALRRQIA